MFVSDTSNSDIEEVLDSTPSKSTDAPPAKKRKPKTAPVKAKVYKLDTTKPSTKSNGKDNTAKKAKTTEPAKPKVKAKEAKKEAPAPKKAKATDEPKKVRAVQAEVSMQKLEDNVVLKAVRKLKAPMLAAAFAHSLGVHRRVLRFHLQSLSKDKTNGVGMKKTGANWWVSNTAKAE